MARSLKKEVFVEPKLMKKVLAAKEAGNAASAVIKTWSRASTIVPDMIGITFEVHNGKNFLPVKVIEDMIGHKLGEFSPTRKFVRHGGKLQRELETKAK
ncbi:MAG: 30S ribosomal protein S19, small subunit ribosomal protein S19 [Parcubacteria group bacterium GW2011_GWC1_41_7]|nr:MAG: 30S ribosomal protein S19, small subunit ribosomal protein S19 [Parcubacteria group bacterium GW2011_GWC1_41_7]